MAKGRFCLGLARPCETLATWSRDHRVHGAYDQRAAYGQLVAADEDGRDAWGMSSALPVIAVPDRLVGLVSEGRGRGLVQPAVRVELDRWHAAAGEHAGAIRGLPEQLDRVRGRAFALGCPPTPHGALAAFVASQIWGFGTNGYGPHRLREALAYPRLPRVLTQVRAELAAGDPVAAFRTLCVANEIPRVGPPSAASSCTSPILMGER
jgi:hypothetical protein